MKLLKRAGIALFGLIVLTSAGICAYWYWGDGPNASRAFNAEKYAEVIALYDKELARSFWWDAYRFQMLMQRGYAHNKLGHAAEAAADFDAALTINPKSTLAHNLLGDRHQSDLQWEAALKEYDASLKLDPDNIHALYERAYVYDITLDTDRAIEAYHALRQRNPSDDFTYQREAYNLARKGEMDKAAKVIAAIPINNSYDADAFARRATYYDNCDAPGLGLQDYERALRLAPRSATILASRARTYNSLGEHALAMRDFDQSIEIDPKQRSTFFSRGQERYLAGDYSGALSDINFSVSEAPFSPYALIWLHLTEVRLSKTDHKMLEEKSTKVRQDSWPQPIIEYLLGKQDEAWLRAAAVEKASPADVIDHLCEIDYYIGALALAKGDRRTALPLLRKAKRTCPPGFVELFAARRDLKAMGD
jgi:lipoprotein NlpI